MARYILREEGYDFDEVEADSADDALDLFDPDSVDYDTSGGTIWINIYAINVDDKRDLLKRSFTIDPPEPKCSDRAGHSWQSPHGIVGGLEENPGVWGHGGGVVIHEVCMHCGTERVRDTWAQRPDTGEQGLESVEYHKGKYRNEVEELRERRENARVPEDRGFEERRPSDRRRR